MKKLLYSTLLGLSFLAFQSCDSLDLAPEDYNGSGNYWQNESQVNNFYIGLHNYFRSAMNTDYQYQFLAYGEARGALIRKGTNLMGTSTQYSDLLTNNLSEDNTGRSDWGGFYGRILQVNHLIQEVEGGCAFLSDDARNFYLGTGYGMRAYYYFWLYRSYGGVPLELTVRVTDGEISAEKLYLARSSAEETLAQIKSDVEKSLAAYGKTSRTTSDFHYWNKDATLMLMGEVYLWSAKVNTNDNNTAHVASGTSDLEKAKTALNQISGYSLCPNFATIFSHEGKQRKENPETILALYYDKDELLNTETARSYVYHNNFNSVAVVDKDGNDLVDPLSLNGQGLMYNEYRQSFVESYDANDSRRAATFLEYFSKAGNTFGCSLKKYIGQSVGGNHYFDSDVILYRYADALLMLAEIENGLGNGANCAEYINQIRKRAYGDYYTEDVAYKDAGKAANELAILRERDKEFVAEGKRWFDLLRLQDASGDPLVFSSDAAYADDGVITPVLDKGSEAYKVLWPINTSLMTNDPLLKQTYGYKTNY